MKTKGLTKLRIGLASPKTILGWSYGEVLEPETINELVKSGKAVCPICNTQLKLLDYNPFETNEFRNIPSNCSNCGTSLSSDEIVKLKETGRVRCHACSEVTRST